MGATNQRIAIIGAGPGGLTCARILQRHGIPVTVYERDADAHARQQGGSLDLHEADGQAALRPVGQSVRSDNAVHAEERAHVDRVAVDRAHDDSGHGPHAAPVAHARHAATGAIDVAERP